MKLAYPVKLTPDDTDGGFVVTSRDLPGLITQGDSIEQCLSEAADALDEVIHGLIANNAGVPIPTAALPGEYLISVPATTVAKVAGQRHNSKGEKHGSTKGQA